MISSECQKLQGPVFQGPVAVSKLLMCRCFQHFFRLFVNLIRSYAEEFKELISRGGLTK